MTDNTKWTLDIICDHQTIGFKDSNAVERILKITYIGISITNHVMVANDGQVFPMSNQKIANQGAKAAKKEFLKKYA